jgi:hypothetical protein
MGVRNPVVVLVSGLLLATSSWAGDGVLEINQTCAEVGCFPGDEAGMPVTIDRGQPGSYRLTSNLFTPDPNETVIQISDSHVTLDLNGFSISGPNICSGDPLNCTNNGSGIGVDGFSPGAVGLTVKNGIVRGMGDSGISLAGESHVEGVLAVSNGFHGIRVDEKSVITRCRAVRNRFFGLSAAGSGSLIVGNVVRENGTIGVSANSGGSLVLDNTVTDNASVGGEFSAQDAYARNVFRENGTDVSGGIQIGTNLCGDNTTCP